MLRMGKTVGAPVGDERETVPTGDQGDGLDDFSSALMAALGDDRR